MDKKALELFIADFYQAWKNRDETRIPSFYDKNLRAYSDFTEISLDDIMNRLELSKTKFNEANYIIEDQFIDEAQGKIAIRMKQRHMLKEGGDVKFEAIMLYKVVDYKITEIWMSFYPNADYKNNDQF